MQSNIIYEQKSKMTYFTLESPVNISTDFALIIHPLQRGGNITLKQQTTTKNNPKHGDNMDT